jgi:hypothetical protein
MRDKKISIPLTVAAILLFLMSSCSDLQYRLMTPPGIQKYCSVITGGAESGDEPYRRCVRQEKAAQSKLEDMKVPLDVKQYCERISGSTGGSYQVMLTCILDEMQ